LNFLKKRKMGESGPVQRRVLDMPSEMRIEFTLRRGKGKRLVIQEEHYK